MSRRASARNSRCWPRCGSCNSLCKVAGCAIAAAASAVAAVVGSSSGQLRLRDVWQASGSLAAEKVVVQARPPAIAPSPTAVFASEEPSIAPSRLSSVGSSPSSNATTAPSAPVASITSAPAALDPLALHAPQQQVLYGVLSSSKTVDLQRRLEAVMETWGKKLVDEGRLLVISDKLLDKYRGPGSAVVGTNCSASKAGLPCKELKLLQAAYEQRPQWLMVLGDDNWANTDAIDAKLAATPCAGACVLSACIGCGRKAYCKYLEEQGGLCGGCG
eukprot:TRINITY_DN11710_c0_g1_i2.p1 TRINITY_DN11710_c0_g1~~TRINITY_DN11710_c0_g1_i2.p1  ORF type:complete len:274 (+),score=24.14 TRINITY_DN11710_c0_g1_i2:131-952(+)